MPGSARLGWLRRLEAAGPTPDGDLLHRFHVHGDQDAFELLVHRHAPIVLRVCRAVTGDSHLAEDAAQAVFLALARRAGALAGVRSLAGWMVRVAYRAANRARVRARPLAPLPATRNAAPGPGPVEVVSAAEVASVVVDEVQRLPERDRAAVVLCYLDGLTYAEAAARLGWPAGTVAGRLARARAVLRDRLARRGVVVPAAGLAAALGGPATVPAAFAAGVLRTIGPAGPGPAVAEITHEILRVMNSSVRRTVVCATAALGLAVAVVALPLAAGDKPAPESPPAKKAADKSEDPDTAFDEKLAKEKKFIVVGTVTTADGKTPLEDIEVTASAGIGTLFRTGETKTDKAGKFRLVFRAEIAMEGGKPGGVAVVHVRKPGWSGGSYGWPAQFILTDEPLGEAEQKQYPKYTNLTPGRPSRLLFRMEPAASLKVKLVDGSGKPLAGTRVMLTGDRLPPGASVIADGRTDAGGSFAVADVPRSLYRLVIEDKAGGRGTLELGSIRFEDAAEYLAVATVHKWEPGETHVQLKVTRGK